MLKWLPVLLCGISLTAAVFAAAKPVVARPATEQVQITSGSLQANVERLGKAFGWTVLWHNPANFHWEGDVKMTGKNLPAILKQLLIHYPVQAVFYTKNRVLLIRQRTV